MAYHIAEIEVTQPLPTLSLQRKESGIAILLRRHGRPVAFWLEERRRGSRLEPHELARLISSKPAPSYWQRTYGKTSETLSPSFPTYPFKKHQVHHQVRR
jgi:hypothetical protein